MNKKFKFMGVACASLLFLGGCGEVPTLENGQDAVVSFDSIDGISVDTFYESLKTNYGIGTLLTLIDKQVYEAEFADELADAATYATDYVDYMISYYGSEDDLLTQLSGSFATLDAYEEYLYVSYLQNIAIDEYSKSLITDDQVEKYYDEEYYADVTLSHILITSDASTTADDDEIAEAEETASNLAEEIISKLKEADANGEDVAELFEELAIEYSDDSSTASSGGSLGQINYEDLDYTYDELVDYAITLSDGEYSTEVIETSLGFHVILKVETHEKDSLDSVTDDIRQTLSDNAVSADTTIIIDALEYYREKYGFSINDDDLYDDYLDYMTSLAEEIASYYSY